MMGKKCVSRHRAETSYLLMFRILIFWDPCSGARGCYDFQGRRDRRSGENSGQRGHPGSQGAPGGGREGGGAAGPGAFFLLTDVTWGPKSHKNNVSCAPFLTEEKKRVHAVV